METNRAAKRPRSPADPALNDMSTTINDVLEHVRPPLPALSRDAMDRITRAVVKQARVSVSKNTADDTMIPLRASLLQAINNEIDSGRESLDVSLHNPAVKLVVSHYREHTKNSSILRATMKLLFLRPGDPLLSPQGVASLAEKLKAPPFLLSSCETRNALAKDLIKMNTFVADLAHRLPPIVFQKSAIVSRLTPEEQEALRLVELNVRHFFSERKVDIPWSGDAVLKILVRRSRTIVEVIEETHTRFFGTLAKVFQKKVMLCGGSTATEFQVENGRGVGGSQGPPNISEEGARFRCPPHGVIVQDNLPVLRNNTLQVLIGASGAGKTMTALLTATNASECVLYFKGRDVFKSASGDMDDEASDARNTRVVKSVLAAVTKALAGHIDDLHPCQCTPRPIGSTCRCQCPPLSVTVILDEAGVFRRELRGLCAAYADVCTAIAALLKVSSVHMVFVGTGVDVTAEIGSESHTYRVVPVKARLWGDFSAALLSGSLSPQLKHALGIIKVKTGDPRLLLVRTLLENARCAAIFARRLRDAIPFTEDERNFVPDEGLCDGLVFLAMMTVQEFANLNGLGTADRNAAIDEVLVWTMNAWRRAAIDEVFWQTSSTRYGIAFSGTTVCEQLPVPLQKLVSVKNNNLSLKSLVQKEKSTPGGAGVWEEGYKAGALLYEYQTQRWPFVHIEPAFVSMLMLFLQHDVARRHTITGLTLRTAIMALLCCRVPAVDDSGGDPNVVVEALTPLRRIVNHMTLPLRELQAQRAAQRTDSNNRVLPTDAGQPNSASTSDAKMICCDYKLQPGCFENAEGPSRVQALELLLKAHVVLVLVNDAMAEFADVIALGRAKLVLFQSNFAEPVTMKVVLKEFAKMTPLAAGCSDALIATHLEGAVIQRVPRVGNAAPARISDVPMVQAACPTQPGIAAEQQQALTEHLIGIGSGRGDLSGWACAAVLEDPAADLTAAADFVVDSVLVHAASIPIDESMDDVRRDAVKASAAFDSPATTRPVGAFCHPLLGGAWQQTVVYTPPNNGSITVTCMIPLRVTYRYFFLEATPDDANETPEDLRGTPQTFYPVMSEPD